MSFWDTVRGWFKSEVESAKDLASDLESDWSSGLDRKEAELAATPEERIGQLQDQIADNDSSFDEIKAKIDSTDIGSDDGASGGVGGTGIDFDLADNDNGNDAGG